MISLVSLKLVSYMGSEPISIEAPISKWSVSRWTSMFSPMMTSLSTLESTTTSSPSSIMSSCLIMVFGTRMISEWGSSSFPTSTLCSTISSLGTESWKKSWLTWCEPRTTSSMPCVCIVMNPLWSMWLSEIIREWSPIILEGVSVT